MQKGRAGLRDLTEPGEGVQQPGVPSEKATEGGRVTPDHWEELLKPPEGEPQGGQGGGATYSNSERGEDTDFDPEF